MKIGPLQLFTRTSRPESCAGLAWHNPRSITWRWALWVSRSEKRSFQIWPYHTNDGWQCIVILPFLRLDWLQQKPMWRHEHYDTA
jgi:hypothetical protein